MIPFISFSYAVSLHHRRPNPPPATFTWHEGSSKTSRWYNCGRGGGHSRNEAEVLWGGPRWNPHNHTHIPTASPPSSASVPRTRASLNPAWRTAAACSFHRRVCVCTSSECCICDATYSIKLRPSVYIDKHAAAVEIVLHRAVRSLCKIPFHSLIYFVHGGWMPWCERYLSPVMPEESRDCWLSRGLTMRQIRYWSRDDLWRILNYFMVAQILAGWLMITDRSCHLRVDWFWKSQNWHYEYCICINLHSFNESVVIINDLKCLYFHFKGRNRWIRVHL